MEISVEQETEQLQMDRPHVVILGAGASCAAFPTGDKNGIELPLMNNLVDILGLGSLLSQSGIEWERQNFEELYDRLHRNDDCQQIRKKLEREIRDYFSKLKIGDEPTLYDHLLLSLRAKDIVATFNWDPFLLQAYRRNAGRFDVPRPIFLHGNVGVGHCEKDKFFGYIGTGCKRCGCLLVPTKLLYPIAEKNYHVDDFISRQWSLLNESLNDAFMITVFGYGAPQSDVSAIDLMRSAWGGAGPRVMEQTEIIDHKTESELRSTWDPFIHSHHYETHSCFYDSWIANHPRRTGEAYINQFSDAKSIHDNPIPKKLSFEDLWAWYGQLKQAEDLHENG